MSIKPSLSFTPKNDNIANNGFAIVLSGNGDLYAGWNFFSNQRQWQTNFKFLQLAKPTTNLKNIYMDTAPFDVVTSYLFLYNDGSLLAYDNRGKIQNQIIEPPANITFISAIISGSWITAVCSDNNLYAATVPAFRDGYRITSSSWGKYNTTIKCAKIIPRIGNSRTLFVIDTTGGLWYAPNATNSENLNATWTKIADKVVDAACDNNDNIWYISSSDGNIHYKNGNNLTGEDINIPSPPSNGVQAIYVGDTTSIGVIGNDGSVYYSNQNINNSSINWIDGGLGSLGTSGNVSNPEMAIELDYTIDPKRLPIDIIKPTYTINLSGTIPVHNWRKGTEYGLAGCGYGGWPVQRKTRNVDKWPIEGPDTCPVYNYGFSCAKVYGLVTAMYDSWNWVYPDYLTHVFGEFGGSGIFPNGSIPRSGIQYGNPSAKDLGITPFNKVIVQGYENWFNTSSGNPNPPTFRSLSFLLPDPTHPKVDPYFPYILVGYYKANMLDINQLNDYLSKYAFTKIIDPLTNKTIPRYDLSSAVGILPNVPIDAWKQIPGNTFSQSANNYCSNDVLTTDWCYNHCKEIGNDCDINLTTFCRSGGSGTSNFPTLTKGILLKTPITLDMLNKAYPKYFDVKTKKTCGCFMPDDFYDYIDQQKFQELKKKPEDYTSLYERKAIGIGGAKCAPFANCTSADAIHRKSQKDFICPNLNLLECKQENNINITGDAQENTFQNEQIMNCAQNVTDSTNTSTPSSTSKPSSPSKPSSTSKPPTPAPEPPSKGLSPLVIAIIIAVILIVLGGGAIMIF